MWLYAVVIFLSAFLLFAVQPLIARFILPWFGGGPGVWSTCMLFFQMLLVAGYGYAHLLHETLSRRGQMIVHIAVLIGAVALMPIVPGEAWKPVGSERPIAAILTLLLACLGGPYFVLSATGPLLQAWFSGTPGSARAARGSPYKLYAVSNAGSLLALLAYPFVVEPQLSRNVQALAWSWGFVLFAILCALVAVHATRTPGPPQSPAAADRSPQSSSEPDRSITVVDVILWMLLPACASIMLLAVTAKLSEEIAPIPFLWVLPLATYLLTFIVCFQWPTVYRRLIFGAGLLLCPWLTLLMVSNLGEGVREPIAILMAILFCTCMACHGETYRLRPPARMLTASYLAVACGGALGGAFVAVLAPLIFPSYWEYYIGLYGAMALVLACLWRDPRSRFHRGGNRLHWMTLIALALLPAVLLARRAAQADHEVALRKRNFYGVLSLTITRAMDAATEFRKLMHGRISHGAQFVHPDIPEARRAAATYYGPHTGMGLVLTNFPTAGPLRVGVVGLGAGTACAYLDAGDMARFYEINPLVEQFAEHHFTYLDDARQRGASVDVILGDARLSLEREPSQKLDVLVLDAFSGDAIPIHLLTAEAFAIYLRHLNEGGAILTHVSSQSVFLHPVVHKVAEQAGLQTVFFETQSDDANAHYATNWVLSTKNQRLLDEPAIKAAAIVPPGRPILDLWTDDHASLLEVLR